ncbi:RNA polymerase, sigma subunit, SigV [Caloramator quimbayensis]|uniref:RNA polymerase, sigma subunit, SigV n=1 Tax=Caloramator quimbayensis TaxID=1147123 RepID=A0A1T4WHF9_9CLOT|nr:sigma-70 family RNA polymerase sigma factor [Caloramator quimbayensis]SKA76081.1 RNA polymerase, sigma subunit, SigV [Caloramator quimbayensis]
MHGDGESFSLLIKERKEKIYRIAYSYVNNADDALEIVQEVVYKAFLSIKMLKYPEYFDTWIIRITINTSINYLKRYKKVLYLNEEFDNYISEGSPAYNEEVIDLYNALSKLDAKYKTVVILKYFEDLTFQEISDILDLPVNTVKTQLYRALDIMKLELDKEGSRIG